MDLNTASASLLEYISGISKAIAKNIVAYREENGRFAATHDLIHVTGINESKLALIQDHITI